MLPTMFPGNKTRFNLGLFIERSTRIDYFFRYYGMTITFLIMAYCLNYNKGISKEVKEYILIVAILDIFHLVLFSARGFGEAKLVIGVLILYRRELSIRISQKFKQLCMQTVNFKMVKIARLIWEICDMIYGAFWTFTTVSFTAALARGLDVDGMTVFDGIERVSQLLVILSPTLYLWVRNRDKKKQAKADLESTKLDNEIKREELRKLKEKNDV